MRGIWLATVACLAVGSLASPQEPPDRILVHYDFEEDDIETGPYTLWIFEGARGSVSLSSTFRYGGFRSVEIRDHAGDGDFAELQGFFTDKWSGQLYIHFAILVAEPAETLNVAFAGRSHFSLREHGLAIWFKTVRGVLHQVNGGQEQPLFEVEAFTWYVFDIAYDVDRGRYDVTISAEGRSEPVVTLREQTSVLGIPGSQLGKFSFIGDIPGRDTSNAWFYVDDIVVANDAPVSEKPFVAPARRMLFVDIHNHYRKLLYKRPGCVPALGYEDFDLSPADLWELSAAGLDGLLRSSDSELPPRLSPFLRPRLLAMRDWREGCWDGTRAVELFRRARTAVPSAKIYAMSEVLALVAARQWREADALFLSIYSSWQDDPRYPAISASVGVARGDLEQAERWLFSSAEVVPRRLKHPLIRRLWSKEIDPGLVRQLEAEFPTEWPDLVRTALSAELRFYVLLWQRRYGEARAYSERMAALFERMALPTSSWFERQADAAFYDGDYLTARTLYEESVRRTSNPDDIYLKLSDTHFKLGNLELERFYREKVYGSLRPE